MTSRRPKDALRRGWTTGACATAAVRAAYAAILTGEFPDPVSIRLPRGEEPAFTLSSSHQGDNWATASIIKDAGDDPDVTHGAEISVTVRTRPADGQGVVFFAGPGVGKVTKPGLALAVGQPAINPAPRAMICAVIGDLAQIHGASGDVDITIAIAGGEALAAKTSNPRLGIVGGLSILGTTGIVIPYSCSSWIHSIRSGIDVARALGHAHIAAATGRTSEAAVLKALGLPRDACIDMGDFAGGLLKYLRRKPIARLTLAGGFAKISKLAAGNMDLHSARSKVELDALAAMIGELGGGGRAIARAKSANTAGQVLTIAQTAKLPLGDLVAGRAREVALATLAGGTEVAVLIYDRRGREVGRAGS